MQEEEAALIAMGAVLEWEVLALRDSRNMRLKARVDTERGFHTYNLRASPDYSPEACTSVDYWFADGTWNGAESNPRGLECYKQQHWYNSVAEAKAACEIHAATGEFPPSVEPTLAKEKNDDCNV